MNTQNRMNKKTKKKRWRKKILLIVLAISAMLVSTTVYYGWNVLQNFRATQERIFNDNLQAAKNVTSLQNAPFTVLLVGVGTNGDDGQNTLADSINLITVNPIKNYAELIAIPRDSFVPFGDQCLWGAGYYDKITHATGIDAGGASCLQSTLEDVFNIDINYYVSVDFNGFIQIVDALGGVEMKVPDLRAGFDAYAGRSTSLNDGTQWCEYDSQRREFAICFDKFGTQQLNGEQALALARSRHYDGDRSRNLRQSELIKAIAKKSLSASGIFSANALLEAIGNSIETNIPVEQFNDFINLATTLFSPNASEPFAIRTTQLSGRGATRKGHRISSTAYFSLVSINSIESIRLKLATALSPDSTPTLNVEGFSFSIEPETSVTYDETIDVGMDVTDANTIRQFH